MKYFTQLKKFSPKIALPSVGLGLLTLLFGNAALADMLTDSQAALDSAKTDALTVGGYVVAAVASLVVVGMILSMMRKAS